MPESGSSWDGLTPPPPLQDLGCPWLVGPRLLPPKPQGCPQAPPDPSFPSQITETTLEVTQSTKDLDVARGTVGALRRSLQTLEIDLEALRNQVPQNSPNSPKKPQPPPNPSVHSLTFPTPRPKNLAPLNPWLQSPKTPPTPNP